MLFRTQIIFCSSELRLHFRIAEVGSLLSLNRAWRAQVTVGIFFRDRRVYETGPIAIRDVLPLFCAGSSHGKSVQAAIRLRCVLFTPFLTI